MRAIKIMISGALCCSVLAGPSVFAQQQEYVVDLGSDRARFAIVDTKAQRSPATRLNEDLVGKNGQRTAPTYGYELRSTLIVIADDARPLAEIGLHPVRIEPLPTVWTVEFETLAQAIEASGTLRDTPGIDAVYLDAVQPFSLRSIRGEDRSPVDPLLDRQWTFHNATMPGADARVLEAWALGVSGKGITIGLIEHPVDATHPDLADRFDPALSIPSTQRPDAHSTAVASIALASSNGVGMVGVAPDARLATMPRGSTLDTIAALVHQPEQIRIRMASWGREDRRRLSRLDPATRLALEHVARPTDGSPGSAVVWAAGNGGMTDRLDYDAISSSRFVLPIGAVGDLDLRASYTRPGSAQFAVAHSSGNARSVVAARLDGEWNMRFGGTSAAAPLAAGAIALALEANPNLTARDIEHMIASSARPLDERSGVWITNAAGVRVSDLHGFGAIDAHAMVLAARQWEPLPPEVEWSSGAVPVGIDLPDPDHHHHHAPGEPCIHEGHTVEIMVDEDCVLSHVEVIPTVRTSFVGDLSIVLTSPGGTASVLALARDDPQDDLRGHIFTSRRHWGESAAGVWTITITDEQPGDRAHWESIELRLFGMQGDKHQAEGETAP